MARRETVNSVDFLAVEQILKNKRWSNSSLCKELGKHDRWLSEVKRGRNLPSPEEAARMCVILNATPEEFLTEQEDIEKVKALIHGEVQKGVDGLVDRLMFGQKESAPAITDEDALDKELISLLRQMNTPEKIQAAKDSLQLILKLTDK